MIYGITDPEKSRDYVEMAQQAGDILNESRVPGAFWADFLPFIKYIPPWVPGAASSKFARRSRPVVESAKDRPFDGVKEEVVGDISRLLSPASTRVCPEVKWQ